MLRNTRLAKSLDELCLDLATAAVDPANPPRVQRLLSLMCAATDSLHAVVALSMPVWLKCRLADRAMARRWAHTS